MSGFDLLDPDRGIFVSAHHGRGAFVFDGSEVLAAGPAEDSLGEELRSLRFGEGAALNFELDDSGPAMTIGGERLPEETLARSRATGTLLRGSKEIELSGLALEVGSSGAMPEQTLRSIAVILADGGLLALAALSPPGAEGHGDEEIAAGLAEPDRPAEAEEPEDADAPKGGPFAEVLLSTEYDAEGRQRRATLELSPQGDSGEPPLRGAGTLVCGATLEVGGRRIDTAFFRWSIDGRPGLGRYEIVRPR